MTSEVSHHDITGLRAAHSQLERQLRELSSELSKCREQDLELELRLTRQTAIFVAAAVAITLFIVFCVRPEQTATHDSPISAPANAG